MTGKIQLKCSGKAVWCIVWTEQTRRLCHGITQYKKVFKYSVVREMKELDRITGWLGIQHTRSE